MSNSMTMANAFSLLEGNDSDDIVSTLIETVEAEKKIQKQNTKNNKSQQKNPTQNGAKEHKNNGKSSNGGGSEGHKSGTVLKIQQFGDRFQIGWQRPYQRSDGNRQNCGYNNGDAGGHQEFNGNNGRGMGRYMNGGGRGRYINGNRFSNDDKQANSVPQDGSVASQEKAEVVDVNGEDQKENNVKTSDAKVDEKKTDDKQDEEEKKRALKEYEERKAWEAKRAEERKEEEKKMTLKQYEELLSEKRKALEAKKAEERKVTQDKDFESMNLVGKKSDDPSDYIKLNADAVKPKKENNDRDEKKQKAVKIVVEPPHYRRPYRSYNDANNEAPKTNSSDQDVKPNNDNNGGSRNEVVNGDSVNSAPNVKGNGERAKVNERFGRNGERANSDRRFGGNGERANSDRRFGGNGERANSNGRFGGNGERANSNGFVAEKKNNVVEFKMDSNQFPSLGAASVKA